MDESTEVKAQRPIVGRVAVITGKEYAPEDNSWEEDLSGIWDQLESYQKENESKNAELVKLFESDPLLVAVIKDEMAGYSFAAAVVRNIDMEELMNVSKDEQAPDDLQKAKQSRIEAKQKAEADAKALEEAKANSAKAIDEYITANNLSEDEATKFFELIDELVMPIVEMKIDGNVLTKLSKVLNYDSSVASAKEEGLNEGTNKKIEAQKETMENENPLPDISSGGGSIEEKPKERKGIMGGVSYLDYLNGKK
jgi:hypothetical protein